MARDDLRGGMNVPDLGKMARTHRNGDGEIPLSEVPGEVRDAVEARSGMRCFGCGRRITVGFRFVRFVARRVEGKQVVAAEETFACSADDCDYAPRAAADSHAMTPVEWAYLDEVVPEETG